MKKIVAVLASSFLLTSCLVPSSDFESSGTTTTSGAPPCVTGFCTETPEVTQTAYEAKPFIYDFLTSNAGPTYFVTNEPSWMEIDSARTRLTGTPNGSGTISDVKVSIYDGTNTEVIGPFDIDVIGDPLAKYAWHLGNTGQKGFSTGAGTAGQDINLAPAVADGIIGTGVTIAVSDTGVEHTHEDLTANFLAGVSRDYSLSSPWLGDSLPTTGDDGHGTAVTGLIAAVGWNSKGSRGIAPGAGFAAFKYIGEADTTAKYVDQASHDFDIYNYSYGYSQCTIYPTDVTDYKTQLEYAVTNYRSNKGSLYVKSAGNDYIADLHNCDSSVDEGTTPYFGNSNIDQSNQFPEHITVGAINAKGLHSSYSSPGANLWISAPGGEFGDDSPAMITTDMAGCSNGFSVTSNTTNAFDRGTNTLNTNCNYTSTMNGTSSAAPVTSGVIALMLEANPALGWRDVKHILATTATVVNSSAGNTAHPWGYNLTGHVYQQGWVKNYAGYKFHNWYGFGRINAGAAVAAAAAYTDYLPDMVETKNPSGTYYYGTAPAAAIPDHSKTGVSSAITSLHNLVTESVQVVVSITHPYISDLGIEITSPKGTKSIVMNINSVVIDSDMSNAVFTTNAFYGEPSNGTWTIKVIDGSSTGTGTLDYWNLNIFGHVDANRTDVIASGPPVITSPASDGLTVASLTSSPIVTWTAPAASDVMRYEYSIGTTAGDDDVVEWQSNAALLTKTKTGLSLTDGDTYYFNVRAVDTSENVSTVDSVSWVADI